MSFIAELRRRNVFRAAAAYVAVAWLLVQVAETTFPAFGLSDAALRNLILVLTAGFIPAIALSWAFELTPEGWRRDQDIDPASELSLRTRRMLDRGIVIALALGIAYFAFDKFVLDPARDEARIEEARQAGRTEAMVESFGERSIAVLPFANLSTDPEQEFFAAGVAEEILHLLERIPDLRVISRSSSFVFKDRDVPVPQIAQTLNVGHVLEGSVRKSGDVVRVTAQLIDARSDTQLWSEVWERPIANVFAIQDEIAGEVASRLQIELADAPTSHRVDTRAYEFYLKGRHLNETFRAQDLPEAESALKRAVEIQPDYADAWLALSLTYYRYFHEYRGNPDASVPYGPGEAYRLSTEALEKALALDPNHPTGLTAKAARLFYDDPPDEKAAAELFERAIAEGSAGFAGTFAFSLGQIPTAVTLSEIALRQDPMCNWCRLDLAQAYGRLGRFEEAELMLQSLKDRGTGLPLEEATAGLRLLEGRTQEALDLLDEIPPEGAPDLWIMALHQAGRTDEADQLLADSAASADAPTGANPPPYSYLMLAKLNARLGRPDPAFAWLEKVVGSGCRVYRINFGDVRDDFGPLTEDPRWEQLAQRCNRSPKQIEAIGFDPPLQEL